MTTSQQASTLRARARLLRTLAIELERDPGDGTRTVRRGRHMAQPAGRVSRTGVGRRPDADVARRRRAAVDGDAPRAMRHRHRVRPGAGSGPQRVVSVYGYDPARVEVLHHRTREALAALATIRSDDPAAADAMLAVARTRDTLEHGWMPFIEAIRTSTVMNAWRHALDGDASSHRSRRLGDSLALRSRPGSPPTVSTTCPTSRSSIASTPRSTRLTGRGRGWRRRRAGRAPTGGDRRRSRAQGAPRSRRLRGGDGGTSRRSWCHRHPRRDRCPGVRPDATPAVMASHRLRSISPSFSPR